MKINIVDILYITPKDIIPDCTISAQNIFKGFNHLFSPYQVLDNEIKEKLERIIPGEKILVAFTERPVKIPGTEQICLIEQMIKKYFDKLGISRYYRKMQELDWKIIKTFGGLQDYSGASLKALDNIKDYNLGEISLADKSFGKIEIEKILTGKKDLVDPVCIGNYKREALIDVADDLLTGEIGRGLKPASIGSQIFLLIDQSYSMERDNRLEAAKYAAEVFYRHLGRFYPKDALKIFKFAFFAEKVSPEKIHKIELAECTNLGYALERVYKSIDFRLVAPKHIYIFTDGLPHDYYETIEICKKINKAHIDFDLVVFKASNEEILADIAQYPHLFKMGALDVEEMYLRNFTNIASAAGGNITLIKRLELLNTTQITLYEHYKVYLCETVLEMLADGIPEN